MLIAEESSLGKEAKVSKKLLDSLNFLETKYKEFHEMLEPLEKDLK